MNKPDWLNALLHRPLYLLLPVAMAAVALWGFWPRARSVDSAVVSQQPLVESFTEEGRTRLHERYLLTAPVDGWIERVHWQVGDTVEMDAPLITLRPASAALFDPANRAAAESRWRAAQAEVSASAAELSAAQSEQQRANAEFARAQALSKQGLIAVNQLDTLRALKAGADATLRAAQARAQGAATLRDGARAIIDLQGQRSGDDHALQLRAPTAGRIMHRHVESEGPVRSGQPLLEVGDPHSIEVVVEALTADATRLVKGTPVQLLHWGGSDPLSGSVDVVEPAGFTKISALGVEEQRVLVVVTIADPEAARAALGDGFRVDAKFQVWRAASVLTLPDAALFRDGAQWAVYAIEGGRARLRHVQIGHQGEDAVELLSGLSAGAEVVLYPGDTIRDGSRVRGSR